MNSYLYAMKTAFLFFPIIALILMLPYVISQYKKYGSLLIFRTTIIYSFILYLIVIYFLVILPLPPIEEVRNYKNSFVQLEPFYALTYLHQHIHFDITDFSTYSNLFRNSYFYQVIYNIFITIPFGIYLRYYFKCNFKKTFLFSFLLSLFFELTQLSGLYGIYPRPYRIFDVDDLITNTLGGILGYLVAPFVCFFLPSRDRIDEKAYKKGERVSFSRKLVAFFIDILFFFLLYLIIYFCFRMYTKNSHVFLSIWLGITIYYILIPILYRGYTVGRFLVKVRVVSINDMDSKWYQYLLREYTFFYLFIFGIPILNTIRNSSTSIVANNILLLLIGIDGILLLFTLLQIIFRRNAIYIHEKISHTKYISTIIIPKKEENEI